MADGIGRLARERVGAEMKKLLAAPDPAPAVAAMAASGVLMRCLPGAGPALLAPLVHAEGEAGVEPDWIVRLAALGGEDPVGALRLGRVEARELAAIRALLAAPGRVATAAHQRGARAARGAALLMAASGDTSRVAGLEDEIRRGLDAEFPLAAADLMAAGIAAGPALGRTLDAARERWLASGFSLDKAALLAQIGDLGHKD
jgi:poly(A) polymerase